MQSPIEEYLEHRHLTPAVRLNLLRQQMIDEYNLKIDKGQINREVQKAVNEVIKEINKALKK